MRYLLARDLHFELLAKATDWLDPEALGDRVHQPVRQLSGVFIEVGIDQLQVGPGHVRHAGIGNGRHACPFRLRALGETIEVRRSNRSRRGPPPRRSFA
jgi:hypothetical protein